MESKMTEAFTHKPARLEQDLHPIFTKDLWNRVWQAARQQPWFSDKVTYVGTNGGFHYFQSKGVTTGFARIPA
jgi:hypothetical protein